MPRGGNESRPAERHKGISQLSCPAVASGERGGLGCLGEVGLRCPEDVPVLSFPAALGNLPYCKGPGVAVYLSPLFHHGWLGTSRGCCFTCHCCPQQTSAASIQKSCFYAIYAYSLDRCHGDERQTTASDLLAPSAALPAAALR